MPSLEDLAQMLYISLIMKKKLLSYKVLIPDIMTLVVNMSLSQFLKNQFMSKGKRNNWKEFAKTSKHFMDPRMDNKRMKNKMEISKMENFLFKIMLLLIISSLIMFLK